MTTTNKTLIESKELELVQTTQYTVSTGFTAIVDKCTIKNTGTDAVTVNINLVENGGTASTDNLLLTRTIAVGDTYLCPEMLGQVIEGGASISTIAGAANLKIRASGRIIS